jgi:hypothetical protein
LSQEYFQTELFWENNFLDLEKAELSHEMYLCSDRVARANQPLCCSLNFGAVMQPFNAIVHWPDNNIDNANNELWIKISEGRDWIAKVMVWYIEHPFVNAA